MQVYVGKGEKLKFIYLLTIVFRENASGDTAHLIEMVNWYVKHKDMNDIFIIFFRVQYTHQMDLIQFPGTVQFAP